MTGAHSWRRWLPLAAVLYGVLLVASCMSRSADAPSGSAGLPAGDVWCFGGDGSHACHVHWRAFEERAKTPAAGDLAEALWSEGSGRRGVVVVGEGRAAPLALAVASHPDTEATGVVLVDPAGFADSELLGSDLLNRLLHELVAAGHWLAREGVPHFGRWDARLPELPIARVLARTDSNELLARASRAEVPVVMLAPTGHTTASHLESVLARAVRVEPGDAEVWVRRLQAGEVDTTRHATGAWSLPPVEERGLLRFASLVFAASMVSEDLASIGVGLLLGEERIGLAAALGVTALALLLGDLVLVLGGAG